MLSHYRLVEQIGAGGMGVVWRGEDTVLNRTVAIKVLPTDIALDEKRRRMFLDEARLAASVSHGNIVQVHELGREGNIDFIVMEYVEGQPLSKLLSGRPLAPNKVADWGSQVAEGVARAHRKGLIHRDLKPANILVTPEGEVKIVDFGLAVLFEQRDATVASLASALTLTLDETRTRIAGTLPYMSPEQVLGEKLDARSDIFSLGTVLYEMTAGQRPFQGVRPAEVVQEILRSQAPPVHELVPKVPVDLHRVIEKALSRAPADRYQHMEDVAVDLRRLRKGLESGSSASYQDLHHAVPPRRRHAGRLALLGGAVVAVLVAAGVGLRMPRPGSEAPAPQKPAHARSAIAVLPFENLSDEGPHAFFARGLHDELLTQLSKVAALKVISRTSVMGYQGTSKLLKTIATELGVGSVVEGSVQVVGERLRVNVQLIDAATDEHLWAESYDKTLDDAFAIQSEVAQAIVVAVGGALSAAEQGRLTAAPTANAEAYQLYLQGNEYLNRAGQREQNLESAQQLFEQALALDPNFAIAHASLSRAHAFMYWHGHDPSAARVVRAQAEAKTALRLGPDLPEAHFAMGWAEYVSTRELEEGVRRTFQRAADEFAIARKGLPNDAVVLRFSAVAARRLGNWTEVVAAFERAAQLDPRDADLFYYVGGHTYKAMGRYPEAVRAYERALSLEPDLQGRALDLGWTYVMWQGQLDSLRAVLGRLPRDGEYGFGRSVAAHLADLLFYERAADGLLQLPEMARPNLVGSNHVFVSSALYAAWAHRLRGDQAAAHAAFDSARVHLDSWLREHPDDWGAHQNRGLALAGLGRRDEALREARWLEQSVTYREDASFRPYLATGRAKILAQAGDADGALDELGQVLAMPAPDLSVHEVRLDPLWDPIREHPRFNALLAKYAVR
jgi:TolB-like protein/predicted Ser/Thr protein kinase/Flp pilus assembly protein TadD